MQTEHASKLGPNKKMVLYDNVKMKAGETVRYNTCFLFLRAVLGALHCSQLSYILGQAPFPVLAGPSHTGKTFLANLAASCVGLQDAVFSGLSAWKFAELTSKALFFVYNDPPSADVLLTAITKASKDS